MTNLELKTAIAKLFHWPGIYIFRDTLNKPLYIGKSFDLKNRVGQYLKTPSTRFQKMIANAKKLNCVKTNSEIEALILESQYIKKYRPKFNIMLRDDKKFGFVGFTKEKFSKVFITHQPTKPERRKLSVENSKFKKTHSTFHIPHSNFIGPFTDIDALKTALRYLRRIFPYCTCKKLHNNFCLNYHIGKCLGFCCLKDNPEHNRITAEKRLYNKNIRAVREILSGKRNSLLKTLEKEMVALGKKGEFEGAIELRDKIEKLKKVFENARIIQNFPHHGTSKYHSGMVSSDLKKVLGLKQTPIRIEGYDISNIQGVHATGSMVTFINGQPDKNLYRKFKIFRKKTADDVAMIREILERRFRHNEWPFPDLVLIDGGRGQVNSAVKVMGRLKINIPVIGVSKDKHHIGHQLVIPGQKNTVSLNKLPRQDKNLILAIDTEAHRFAVGYYRKLHREKLKSR